MEDLSQIKSVEVDNHLSATQPERRAKVEALLREELEQGHYEVCKNKPSIINAVGAVDKPDSDDIRLIMDASLPERYSLNSYADPEHFKLEGVDDAIEFLGEGWYQAKIDLKKGYRSVPLAASNFEFTGLKWRFMGDTEFTFLRDTRLCMGTSKSPWIFQKLSDAVCKIVRFNGFICIVYLDDYYVCAKSESECRKAYDFLWSLLIDLGFTINEKKSIPFRFYN